jgi:hypothetical protein
VPYRPLTFLLLTLGLGFGLSCGGSESGPSTSDPLPDPGYGIDPADAVPAECAGIEVDRFKELALVDEALTTDLRASNAARGAWSFANLVEQLTPPGMSPSGFVHDWLMTWTRPQRVNSFPVESRLSVTRRLLCPWMRRTPANACDEACSRCEGRELDLAAAPFRLIGFANRLDLRETEDLGGAGEGRLVFGMTEGPADDPASAPMFGTVIFEYRLPAIEGGAQRWADRWHALGRFGAFDEEYKAQLQALTDAFTARGSSPGQIAGSALSTVRVNEREFEWQWDMREYKLTPSGLAIAPTKNSPDASVYNSQQLLDWVVNNRDAIALRRHDLPPALTGGQSQPLFSITLRGVDEPLRASFAKATCVGCHQLENPGLDVAFHYSPLRKGPEKLSSFLNAPDGNDELTRRANSLRRALCGG